MTKSQNNEIFRLVKGRRRAPLSYYEFLKWRRDANKKEIYETQICKFWDWPFLVCFIYWVWISSSHHILLDSTWPLSNLQLPSSLTHHSAGSIPSIPLTYIPPIASASSWLLSPSTPPPLLSSIIIGITTAIH